MFKAQLPHLEMEIRPSSRSARLRMKRGVGKIVRRREDGRKGGGARRLGRGRGRE